MAQGVTGSFELSGIKNTQAKIEYSETYDISTNSSALSVTLYIKNTWYPGNYYLNGSISINGTQAIEFDSFHGTHNVYIDSSDWIAVQASGSYAPPPWSVGDLAHYADGTGSAIIAVDVTGYGSGSGSGWSVSGSGSIALTTIPRASGIASITQNATTQGNIALTMNRKIPNATHVATVTAGGRTLYTSASFATSLSITAARTWFASFPTATSLTATVSVQTYLSGAAIGSPVTASVTVTADEGMKPTGTGWMSCARVQQAAASGIAAYIKGYSSVRFTFDTSKLTMASGATLESFRVVYNGITKSTAGTSVTTDVLNASGTVSFTVYAIDSRGRYAETSASITVENYSPPTLSGISIQRSTAGGVPADEGTYIALAATANISSIGGLNSYTLKASYKAQGGSYGAETAMTSGVLLVIGGGLIAANQSYTARIRLTDALGNTASFEAVISTAEVAFNIRAGGGGAAFGKYAEADNELQLPADWKIKIGSTYLLDMIYPVGSIYLSANATSPQTLFGGTWERIQDKFLLAAGSTYAAGAAGGEAAHTLSKNEMPSHTHGEKSLTGSASFVGDAGNAGIDANATGSGIVSVVNSAGSGSAVEATGWNCFTGFSVNATHTHSAEGGGQAHNNMPPYIAVYIWERTA